MVIKIINGKEYHVSSAANMDTTPINIGSKDNPTTTNTSSSSSSSSSSKSSSSSSVQKDPIVLTGSDSKSQISDLQAQYDKLSNTPSTFKNEVLKINSEKAAILEQINALKQQEASQTTEKKTVLGALKEQVEATQIFPKVISQLTGLPEEVPIPLTAKLTAAAAALGVVSLAGGAGIVGKAATNVGTTMVRGESGAMVASSFATNAKTVAGTTTLLSKLGMSMGTAALTATVVGTYPFARFELAEATDKLGIAMLKAASDGDVETVEALKAQMDEMLNPGIWGQIVSKIPFANVVRAVNQNIKAAQSNSKEMLAQAEKNLRIATGEEESQFAKERRLADEEAAKRQEDKRAADEAYYKRLQDEEDKRKADERKEQEDYYADLKAKKDEDEKRKRQEDETYWAKIRDENDAREAAKRKKDEEYWANIRGENKEDENPPNTTPPTTTPKDEEEEEVTLINKSTGKQWVGPSSLAFGLLKSGGYYELDEEETKKKKSEGGK